MRRAITALLLAFVLFTAGFAVGKEVGARRALEGAGPAAAGRARPGRQLVARYYHATKRCTTCNTIEAYAREALETHFADALATGTVVWETANMDEARHQPAALEYGLLRSSLVLSDRRDGEEEDYRVLNALWDLTGDKDAFVEHVRAAVARVLDAWPAPGAEDGE